MRIRARSLALPLGSALLVASAALGPRGAGTELAEPWSETTSLDGTFLVRYRTTPPRIELGVDFDVEVEVALAGGGELPGDLDLGIDGDMPEHGHGLLRTPLTERLGPRRFRARDLRFFMPGYWELYFDLSHGAFTERALASVVLD